MHARWYMTQDVMSPLKRASSVYLDLQELATGYMLSESLYIGCTCTPSAAAPALIATMTVRAAYHRRIQDILCRMQSSFHSLSLFFYLYANNFVSLVFRSVARDLHLHRRKKSFPTLKLSRATRWGACSRSHFERRKSNIRYAAENGAPNRLDGPVLSVSTMRLMTVCRRQAAGMFSTRLVFKRGP